MSVANYVFCPLCIMPLARVARDKKGRPYFSCDSCGSRCFVRTQQAFDGLLRLIDETKLKAKPMMQEILRRGVEQSPSSADLRAALAVTPPANGSQEVSKVEEVQ